jgi:purine-binding chemotaxis protein CheW
MEQQLVVFELADEYYGVDIAQVESIIKMQAITSVPHAPQFVEGVTNLRGKVLPVIDLRRRFGLPPADETTSSRIVVASVDGIEVGMRVDGVSEVLTVSDNVVEPLPSMVTTVDSAFITDIAKIGEQLVILLDLSKALSLDERAILGALPQPT